VKLMASAFLHDLDCAVAASGRPRVTALLDRAPEILLWLVIYASLMILNFYTVVPPDSRDEACVWWQRWRYLSLGIFTLFIGILSFFPQLGSCSWLLSSPLVRQFHMFLMNATTMEEPPMYLYLSDGGPIEDLGIVQLLRRHQRWILSIDVGDDPECRLLDLREAIHLAREERICSFFDPRDPRRDLEDVLQEYTNSKEPFLHLGVLYTQVCGTTPEKVGDIFHTRMRLIEDRPVRGLITREEVMEGSRADIDYPLGDVKWSRLGGACCRCCHTSRLVSSTSSCLCGAFPHTHTANQFFTAIQWANFCRLGSELTRPAIEALVRARDAAEA